MENTPGLSDSIMLLPAVERAVGFKRETIRQLEASGKFPRRFRHGLRVNGWLASEISAWVADHVAAARDERRAA